MTAKPKVLVTGAGSMISIDELVDIVVAIARKRVRKRHDRSKPQGVRGRNSDNARLKAVLGWSPTVSLEEGLSRTYTWIEAELRKNGRISDTQGVVLAGRGASPSSTAC